LNGSRGRLELVVAEAKRLIETYGDCDDTSKMSADMELMTSHWQHLLDRSVLHQRLDSFHTVMITMMMMMMVMIMIIILPAKAREYVFTGVGLCVCP